jgi:hypothetical protein
MNLLIDFGGSQDVSRSATLAPSAAAPAPQGSSFSWWDDDASMNSLGAKFQTLSASPSLGMSSNQSIPAPALPPRPSQTNLSGAAPMKSLTPNGSNSNISTVSNPFASPPSSNATPVRAASIANALPVQAPPPLPDRSKSSNNLPTAAPALVAQTDTSFFNASNAPGTSHPLQNHAVGAAAPRRPPVPVMSGASATQQLAPSNVASSIQNPFADPFSGQKR